MTSEGCHLNKRACGKSFPSSKGRRLSFLSLLLLFLLALQAAPAHAYVRNGSIVYDPQLYSSTVAEWASEAANWAEQNSSWVAMRDLWTSGMDALESGMDVLEDTTSDSEQAILSAMEMWAASSIAGKQAYIDAHAKDTLLTERLDMLMEQQIPPASEQFLCNSILARQIVPIMGEYARKVSRNLLVGLQSRGRGPTDDANSYLYARDSWDVKCGRYGSGGNNPPTGEAEDGVPAECAGERFLPNFGMAGADIDFSFLGRDRAYNTPRQQTVTMADGSQALEYVPNPENYGELQWIAVRNFCYTAAGPRPSPVWGENMQTPAEIGKRQTFETGVARENVFAEKCLMRLTKLSRPNCDDDVDQVYCEAGATACDAARQAGIDLPQEFGNCSEGLSAYQAEYISNSLCGTGRSLQAQGHAGNNHAAMVKSQIVCNTLKSVWEKALQKEDEELLQAFNGLANMKDYWASIK